MAAAQIAIPAELLRSLADAVLGDQAVRLALSIAQGGDHVVGQAIELAGLVLGETPSESRSAVRQA